MSLQSKELTRMTMQLQLDINHFLSTYWQRKPLFIKQGIANFSDLISPEEMAGLAMEEEVQSRMVMRKDGKWQAQCGPFTDFSPLENNGATLLNQAVNHWHPPCGDLVELFQFIPNWRFDDLMISYSTPEGGVGPHIDQYCVFIIQGQGKRHWRVGEKQDLEEFTSDQALKHCGPFQACIDVVMEPGDILYIPPGCPHEGYAIESSLNYSVGFRAPDQKELLNDFTDHLLQQDRSYTRYSDPELRAEQNYGEINAHETNKLTALLSDLVNQPDVILPFFGQHFSSSNHELDILPLAEQEQWDQVSLIEALAAGENAEKVAGLKFIYLTQLPNSVFVNGLQYQVDSNVWSDYQSLCQAGCNQIAMLKILQSKYYQPLLSWFNLGYFFIDG
ncbi:cupin domain-containing protein [Motilimonas sp. 1_MG-2023]|uniref:cupin domain-containing protein n=1 Tax=Motilimonas sp. 1_MG-2023 TaxID=3062672 RepID=UPI0026E2C5C0|nr:cupin domain-containing protein [Motilimonas sp. 1_MG-2023]MDO6525824.1 cupin domain-containing protein [Motilimonas sp. 1_MG-2023]